MSGKSVNGKRASLFSHVRPGLSLIREQWEYRDPAVVVEIREERAEEMLAAEAARPQADVEIERARREQRTPLSPITARLLKRLRIRELLKTAKGGA